MSREEMTNFEEEQMDEMYKIDELTIENYMPILREDLENYVKLNKLSYESLGDSIGVSGQALRDIVDGVSRSVNMDTWFKIQKAMHLKTYSQRLKSRL